METFFTREGIAFDRRSGLFRIAPEYVRSIRLIGEGYRYDMVQKALRRYAICADREVESEAYIDAGSGETDLFVWHPAGREPVACGNIETLIAFIKEK